MTAIQRQLHAPAKGQRSFLSQRYFAKLCMGKDREGLGSQRRERRTTKPPPAFSLPSAQDLGFPPSTAPTHLCQTLGSLTCHPSPGKQGWPRISPTLILDGSLTCLVQSTLGQESPCARGGIQRHPEGSQHVFILPL